MATKDLKAGTAGYPCQCGEVFETAEDFSNHFDRGGAKLVCAISPAAVKKYRRPT